MRVEEGACLQQKPETRVAAKFWGKNAKYLPQ